MLARVHTQAIHFLRIRIAELGEDVGIEHPGAQRVSAGVSSWSRRMLTRLSQVPLLRAVEQPIKVAQIAE
ncbi:hypothetical protein EYD00_25685 (plasmid) [Agrobacterium sp. 33MFTa1.1]|jgi:hypothetical protein|uniref:hypothetical protein n=1 Tax=Agrobacterium sp. 33MFTa1.1 TaxID=1279031 RepID=UPI000552FD6B|nr:MULTISPECIES: hypothetical protein [Agrobacterium]MBM7327868.1 hypothetical protein [Agrobacterium sp. S2]OAI91453.1 hypothetical protein AYO27_24315 [Rhizobium sp. GHKF11]QBJ16820.1 hypothetical protein EYD00_25685 [Agrobacterium sp. 33MFTa1.1]